MRISDWSSDVCSSDLDQGTGEQEACRQAAEHDVVEDGVVLERRGAEDLAAAPHRQPVVAAVVGQAARREVGPLPEAQGQETRRVGKEAVSTCRTRGAPYH